MEVYPSFLLLILTLTAQQTFCKPMTSDKQLKITKYGCPGTMRCGPGKEEKNVFHDDKHLKTMDGGRKIEMTYDDRRQHTTGSKEVDIVYSDQSSGEKEAEIVDDKPLNDKPSGSRSGEMTLTKVGDMWLTEDQLPMKMRNQTGGEEAEIMQGSPGMVDTWYHWPQGILYYYLAGRFTTSERQQIESTLRRLQQKIGSDCIKFRRTNRWDAVQIRKGNGCSASVGYLHGISTWQKMSLGWNCFHSSTIEHEFLHSLGIHHTQNHWDRDRYVDIRFENIQSGKENNFWKQPRRRADTFGLPYDYSSVMHYGENSWSKNGERTIVTKDQRYQSRIGQRKGVSRGDVKLIRKMYRCN